MKAHRILLLCSGSDKADILYRSLFGKIDSYIPGSILQLHPDITVVADEDSLKTIDGMMIA